MSKLILLSELDALYPLLSDLHEQIKDGEALTRFRLDDEFDERLLRQLPEFYGFKMDCSSSEMIQIFSEQWKCFTDTAENWT